MGEEATADHQLIAYLKHEIKKWERKCYLDKGLSMKIDIRNEKILRRLQDMLAEELLLNAIYEENE